MIRKSAITAAALLASAVVSTPAQAVTFNLISSINTSTAAGASAQRGFEIAAGYWASVFTDNVVINLNIGFASLGTGILGQTGSTRANVSMQQAYTALQNDRTTSLDNAAVASLRPLGTSVAVAGGGAVSAVTNNFNNGVTATNGYTDLSTRIDNDGSFNNSLLAMNTAVAKSLGITTTFTGTAINYGASDGSVTFSTNFAFDFDPTDGIDSQSFDFIGVAIHEIGHALGFVSGVDSYDSRTAPGQTNAASLTSLENSSIMSVLDLYRYSSAGNLDWSTQNTPFFSIDGGANQLFGDSRFSQGTLNGDGRQASHWKDSAAGVPQLGILDPTSGRGQLQEITALDLAAYDAMGWNVNFDVLANAGYRFSTAQVALAAGVPEPATWAMLIGGFGLLGGVMRRRGQVSTAVTFA